MNNKEKLHKSFETIYNNLNAKQKKAVDTIDGPVMVIAGPGTGKTQILSARVGKILLDTDTLPENILCLTYTDAGTIAMRKRLQTFIGSDAYRVNICTFHAFCNDIIQENLSYFARLDLDPISELERTELLKQLIDNFSKNHPLKRNRGDVYYEINNLQWLFSSMKREGWKPDFLYEKIDEYLNDLPNRDEYIVKRATKEFKKGDIRTDKIEEQKLRMEKLKAAIAEFNNYESLMNKKGRYDFDDMINWVIKAFEENNNLLLQYQEKYLYIMVDEFQDTSGTQNKIIELLINYWDKPNVFVVGDDDQSIYRFQGANVENMLGFAKKFDNEVEKIVLENNYRSVQPILDISKILIEHNRERLVNQISNLTKDLVASNDKIKQLTIPPVLQVCNTQKEEMVNITLQVEKLLQQGVQPNKIAVLYRENKYGETLSEFFKLKKITYYSKRSLNLLNEPLAQKLLLILEYLAAELDYSYGGDEMLFEILHFKWLSIPPIEIAKLSMEVADKQFSENKTSLRKLLNDKSNAPAKDLFSTNIHLNLKKASVIIEELITDAVDCTLQVLFENILRKTGLLQHIQQSNEKHWYLQVITALFDFIKVETRRNPNVHLKELVNIVSLMRNEKINLPIVEINGSDKGVNLLTIHGSKGLEFEHVFVAGCNSILWERKRKANIGYALPDTIFNTANIADDDEELRRLFYVALTRAEKYLRLSYFLFKEDGKEVEPTRFISEIQDNYTLQTEAVKLEPEQLNDFQLLLLNGLQAPEISSIEEDLVTRLLQNFSMNVTALNNYLKCPLHFYYQNLVRVPAAKNEATVFGSAVHFALQRLFEKMQNSSTKQFPDKEMFVLDFEWFMKRNREFFTAEQFKRRWDYGKDVLNDYYDKYIHQFNKIVAIERSIRNVVVNNIPLKGKLDKIEFDGKLANVVDYKSGKYENAIKKLKQPNEKEPNGGDYWRQAVFYKILIDNYEQKDWKAISTEFDFVEPDEKNEYQKVKLVIEPADVETVKQQITSVWQNIQQRDFYKGCGKEDCYWCNFVKNNELQIALYEVEEE